MLCTSILFLQDEYYGSGLSLLLHSYSNQGDMHTYSVHSATVSKSFGVQLTAAQSVKPAVTH